MLDLNVRQSWSYSHVNLRLISNIIITTGGMGKECLMYHNRLAQLIAIKKGEQYAKTISCIRTRTSFALLRSALVCLRDSRTRRVPCDIKNVDIDVEVVEGAIQEDYWIQICFLSFKWQIFVNKALRTLFNFPSFFSDFLIKNAIDLENGFFFLNRNGLS